MLVCANSDGTVDNTFGTNGQVITNFGGTDFADLASIALQPDLRIVVAGAAQGNSGGSVDIATAR